MGMFDTIRSSYNLGPEFTDVELQTKDFYNCMSNYWISPDGCLYEMTYENTHTYEAINRKEPIKSMKELFLDYRWVPTGNNGKVEPRYTTNYVEVYPSRWDGSYKNWPRCRILFKLGRVVDYENITFYKH